MSAITIFSDFGAQKIFRCKNSTRTFYRTYMAIFYRNSTKNASSLKQKQFILLTVY